MNKCLRLINNTFFYSDHKKLADLNRTPFMMKREFWFMPRKIFVIVWMIHVLDAISLVQNVDQTNAAMNVVKIENGCFSVSKWMDFQDLLKKILMPKNWRPFLHQRNELIFLIQFFQVNA